MMATRVDAAKRGAPNDIPIIEIQKTARQRIRVAHKAFKGNTYVDVRLYVVDESGEYVPTARGIAIRHEHLAQVIQGLVRASREIAHGGSRD